ncbi:MAG: glycine betaine ABC transporter substrate-binding protein [Nocardioidaceae bacterium]
MWRRPLGGEQTARAQGEGVGHDRGPELHREPDHGGDLSRAPRERRLRRDPEARRHTGHLLPQLQKGNVQVVPDYLAGIGDYLNTEANGPDAKPITSNSAEESLTAVQPLAEEVGVTLLTPAEATDQNGFFVTQDYASENELTTLSDLGALGEPITLAAAKDCPDREDCALGLESVYGISIEEVLPLGFGLAPTFQAVTDGEAELGQTGTTDGTLDAKGLVLLEDDKGIQPAQNLTPAVNSDWLGDHPDVEETLDELSGALTTEDLAALNLKVDQDREKPEDVAAAFLEEQGLI